jgi:hypothetical protein
MTINAIVTTIIAVIVAMTIIKNKKIIARILLIALVSFIASFFTYAIQIGFEQWSAEHVVWGKIVILYSSIWSISFTLFIMLLVDIKKKFR